MIISQVAQKLNLTPEQKKVMKAALFTDPPKFTHDIYVNYAIDCFLCEEFPIFNKDMYEMELKAHNELISDHSDCLAF